MKIFTMTKTVSKNLASGPATLMHPQRERVYPLISRGRIENAIERCIFCGLCAKRCPTCAIVVAKEDKAWQIDRLKCCICNLCVDVCPVKCLATDNHYAPSVPARNLALHRQRQEPAPPGDGPEAKPDPG